MNKHPLTQVVVAQLKDNEENNNPPQLLALPLNLLLQQYIIQMNSSPALALFLYGNRQTNLFSLGLFLLLLDFPLDHSWFNGNELELRTDRIGLGIRQSSSGSLNILLARL